MAKARPNQQKCSHARSQVSVAIMVKDSYETAGLRTVCGRPDLADYVPTQDAEAVSRLRPDGRPHRHAARASVA